MNKDIRSEIRQRIEELKEQIKKYESTLETLDEFYKEEPEPSLFNENSLTAGKKKLTLKMKVSQILKNSNIPMTSREILNSVNEIFPQKQYTFDQFSGQFSIIYRRKQSGIKKFEVDTAPANLRVFYCFKNWFSGNDLKEEYKMKLRAKHGIKI